MGPIMSTIIISLAIVTGLAIIAYCAFVNAIARERDDCDEHE